MANCTTACFATVRRGTKSPLPSSIKPYVEKQLQGCEALLCNMRPALKSLPPDDRNKDEGEQ